MRIFDTRWIGDHGIGRFAKELYARLTDFQSIKLGGHPSRPFDPVALEWYLSTVKPRLFFSPGYNVPLGAPCPFAFCIHDLNHLATVGNSTSLKRSYYRYIIKPALRRAHVVFTVSDFSRRAICEWGNVPEHKVINVGNGVSGEFHPGASEPCPVGHPYFLYVGNHRPHKNFERFLEAFARASLPIEYLVVSTGHPTNALRQTMERLKLAKRVLFAGNLSDARLAALYRSATALALVSLYEGFGLPIVEAMACGTPVLASTVASMPEIAGEAAVLVDPLDVDAIANALERLSSDESLRLVLKSSGLERAKLYNWDVVAQRVSSTLQQY